MQTATRKERARAIRQLMQTEGEAVAQNTQTFNAGRYASVERLDDYEGLKDRARAIKEDAIARLPELIEQVREQVEARGGTVYLADDAADANRYIASVAEGAGRLVKSKSMTSEEIEVNEHLAAQGIDVVETDLGEWVLQVADEAPSHIVAPAIHKSREGIAELFRTRFNPDTPLDSAEALTRFAREKLGALIREADVGMTGANFITADSGTLALVTSEGNARKTALVPPTYIAVAGVEKIIPTVEDLQPFVELIGRSGTGQDLTSYLSLFTPPFPSPVVDARKPDEPMRAPAEGGTERTFHLVLIDNGRMAMRDDAQLRETLYCIRCGACSNACANFQQVGGHAFGGETYSGGIATGWEAGVHGLDSAASFNDLCTGCSRCVPACPVNIDIPWINDVVRSRIHQNRDAKLDWLVDGLRPNGRSDDASESGKERAPLRQQLFAHFETLARIGSATAPLSNWVNGLRPVRALLERAFGIDRRRALPAFARTTLRDWFAARSRPSNTTAASHASAGGHANSNGTPGSVRRQVVLYPDVYTNYVHVDRGKAAVRALEALGVEVHLPDVPESGRAPLSQGLIGMAEKKAKAVWAALQDPVEAGYDVVVIEPTDLAMFQGRYDKFLPDVAAEALREAAVDIMAYIGRVLDDGADAGPLQAGDGRPIAYHSHCQQRTLGADGATSALLERLGYDVTTSSVECCGMAGSFGYKSEYYDLSMKVGEALRDQFGRETPAGRTVVASGTSCQEQLHDLLSESIQHPIQLIAPDG
jgi:iron-sulfur cluster protein